MITNRVAGPASTGRHAHSHSELETCQNDEMKHPSLPFCCCCLSSFLLCVPHAKKIIHVKSEATTARGPTLEVLHCALLCLRFLFGWVDRPLMAALVWAWFWLHPDINKNYKIIFIMETAATAFPWNCWHKCLKAKSALPKCKKIWRSNCNTLPRTNDQLLNGNTNY